MKGDEAESKLEADYDLEHASFLSLDMRLKTHELAKSLLKVKSSPESICKDTSKFTSFYQC